MVEALLLYLLYQGTAWARSCLVLIFSISAAELTFGAYDSLAPGQGPDRAKLAPALVYAANCVLLLRASVTAFMRRRRLEQLSPELDTADGEPERGSDDDAPPGGAAS